MNRRPTVNLRRVTRLGTGHTPSRQHPEYWENCTIPWLTLADVWQLRDDTVTVVNDTQEQISELGVANSSAVVHPAGTVAMSRTASVGFSCILGRDMATSQDFVTWTCGPLLDPRFLLYSLRGQRDRILGMRMGSTHQTIYMPDVERIETPLPALSEQRAIADFLDTETARIDALIAKKRDLIRLLNSRFEALLNETIWADQVDAVPLKHRTNTLRPIMYGIVLPGPNVPEGIPIVKGGDVAGGRLDPSLLCRTTPEIERPYARARLQEGDLVFAIRGGIGDVDIVPTAVHGANITQDVARIAPAADVESEWLCMVLMTSSVRRQVEMRTTGATVRGLNIWDLKRIAIPGSDRHRQMEDLAKVLPADQRRRRLCRALNRQIDLLVERRQALITAAVTGELDVTARAS